MHWKGDANRLLLALLIVIGFAASPSTLASRPAPNGLGALVRQLVASLRGGGDRAEAVLVPADSASAAVLRLARLSAVSAAGPELLLCPGSTEADGRATAPPIGYVVQAVLTVAPDTATRQLRVTKRCRFRYRGGGRPFGEGATWELRNDGGGWHVTRTVDRWIT